MDCLVTPLKTLMGFSVYLNVQLKFYNLPLSNQINGGREDMKRIEDQSIGGAYNTP